MSIINPEDMNSSDYTFIEFEDEFILKLSSFLFEYSPIFNNYVQILNICVNVIHLLILTRKSLRSNAIFIFMIIICLSDNIQFICSINHYYRQEAWVSSFIRSAKITKCLNKKWIAIDIHEQIFTSLIGVFRRFSAWIAIMMALIRMLTVTFPLNMTISKMGKPKGAIYLSIGVLVLCALIDIWPAIFLRIQWLPDVMLTNQNCKPANLTNQQNVLLVSQSNIDLMSELCITEIIIRFIQTAFYPFLTVTLLIQLHMVKNKNATMGQSDHAQNQGLTKLIVFMTVSFMLAEGLVGFYGVVTYNTFIHFNWDMSWIIYAQTALYIIVNLRALNALSHAFVCFLMSTQYRNVVKQVFCQNAVSKRVIKITKIDKLFTRTSQPNSRIFRSI